MTASVRLPHRPPSTISALLQYLCDDKCLHTTSSKDTRNNRKGFSEVIIRCHGGFKYILSLTDRHAFQQKKTENWAQSSNSIIGMY